VVRPDFDLRTLRVLPECPGTPLSVQICWSHGVEGLPTSVDVISSLTSWLDSWLDRVRLRVKSLFNFERPMVMGLSCGWGTCRPFPRRSCDQQNHLESLSHSALILITTTEVGRFRPHSEKFQGESVDSKCEGIHIGYPFPAHSE
jgi:hypothetical protein